MPSRLSASFLSAWRAVCNVFACGLVRLVRQKCSRANAIDPMVSSKRTEAWVANVVGMKLPLFSAGLYRREQIIVMVGFELLILVDVVTLISRCRALSGSNFFWEVWLFAG